MVMDWMIFGLLWDDSECLWIRSFPSIPYVFSTRLIREKNLDRSLFGKNTPSGNGWDPQNLPLQYMSAGGSLTLCLFGVRRWSEDGSCKPSPCRPKNSDPAPLRLDGLTPQFLKLALNPHERVRFFTGWS